MDNIPLTALDEESLGRWVDGPVGAGNTVDHEHGFACTARAARSVLASGTSYRPLQGRWRPHPQGAARPQGDPVAIAVLVDPSTSETTVQFTLDAGEHAGDVSVVGSFNGWTAGVDTLLPDEDGTRSVAVVVPSDQDVHFRYLASDGVWFDDPDADETTAHGSVLRLATTGSDHTGEESDSHTRADLLPEETAVGSTDPDAQADAILADSEARVREQAADVEGASAQTTPRSSAEATDPL